jgi:hypothetical protein
VHRILTPPAAWAVAVGLADVSNPAILYRLRQCGDWLTLLIGHFLATEVPHRGKGPLIRLIDAKPVNNAALMLVGEPGVRRGGSSASAREGA